MQKIDIVITWVDGSDCEWIRRRAKYIDGNERSGSISSTRFASDNEIYFCIASVLKYVPFSGTIFLVTDKQKPDFLDDFVNQGLCEDGKIKIIDHSEIFLGYESACPNFNSLSIESLIWRINGLSKYFIYLNDDFFFNAPADQKDFLLNNKVVAYGNWESGVFLKIKLALRRGIKKIFSIEPEAKHTVSQMLGANFLGFKKFFKIHHYPHIMEVDVFREFFENHPEFVEKQISYRFRSIDQINPVSFFLHKKIMKKEAVLFPGISIAYLKNSQGVDEFISCLDNEDIKYGCIQSLDLLPSDVAKKIHLVMQRKFKNYLPCSIAKGDCEN